MDKQEVINELERLGFVEIHVDDIHSHNSYSHFMGCIWFCFNHHKFRLCYTIANKKFSYYDNGLWKTVDKSLPISDMIVLYA